MVKKEKIIFIFLFLLVLPVVTAFNIDLAKNNISLTTGETKYIDINITNPLNITFYNLSLTGSNDISLESEINLIESNQTIKKRLKINTDTAYNQDVTLTLKGFFYSNTTYDPRQYNITIDDYGFNPNVLTIRVSDTVKWTNKGTVSHTITKNDLSWDSGLIPVNNNYSRTFTAVETVDYLDTVTSLGGILYVQSNTLPLLTHNEDYDTSFTININSELVETDLEIILYDDNLTIEYFSIDESALEVKNKGEERASNIMLYDNLNWTTFNENDFTLDSGKSNVVTFFVKPNITNTNDTNKTYELKIYSKGSNTNETYSTLDIFIPYSDVLGNETTKHYLDLLGEVLKFCQENPEACTGNQTNASIEYIYRNLNLSFSEKELHDALIDKQLLVDLVNKISSYLKDSEEGTKSRETQNLEYQNETTERISEIENWIKWQNFWSWFKIIGISLVILSVLVIGIIFYVKRKNTEYEITTYGQK